MRHGASIICAAEAGLPARNRRSVACLNAEVEAADASPCGACGQDGADSLGYQCQARELSGARRRHREKDHRLRKSGQQDGSKKSMRASRRFRAQLF